MIAIAASMLVESQRVQSGLTAPAVELRPEDRRDIARRGGHLSRGRHRHRRQSLQQLSRPHRSCTTVLFSALQSPKGRPESCLEARLRATVCEWREVLGRQVPQARQIVTKLLDSKPTFSPESREGRSGFRFQATGTVAKLVGGIVPG